MVWGLRHLGQEDFPQVVLRAEMKGRATLEITGN